MSNQPIDFESAEFALRQSWEVHRQAFGPILEPAFVEKQQVRILLVNALNHISRREVKRGMELLKEIHPHCIYDEDKAAWVTQTQEMTKQILSGTHPAFPTDK